MVDAVLFDYGDTLMRFAYEPELLEAGHRAGLDALGREGLPEPDAVAARFRERYEPLPVSYTHLTLPTTPYV